jgi:hypothetical protein
MASIINYSPVTAIEKAMFNFDIYGKTNFKLSGQIAISVSDSFSYSDYISGRTTSSMSWTSSPEYSWSAIQVKDIDAIANIFSSFANLNFKSVINYDTTPTSSIATPRNVGISSDINISIVNRPDISSWLGISGAGWSGTFGYAGDAGDIVLNIASSIFFSDYSFSSSSKLAQVLMHELGHSLGLAHPHSSYSNSNNFVLSSDFIATQAIGFSKLGFKINSADDMYKEYFTIMSYDDQNYTVANLNAYTPMILDVIALQSAYGEGAGTSGIANDTINAGNIGYRTYFDKGGFDTVDLASYTTGAYFNMGVQIDGASHLVGVLVNSTDASKLFSGGDPVSLRWFYGEYENATGGASADLIIGNSLSNVIRGGDGNDSLSGGDGNDLLYGDAGDDTFDWEVGLRGGNDTMYGGLGNDVYVLYSLEDLVVEYANEGVDTVWVNFSYSLLGISNVENLSLYETSSYNLTGNELSNTLAGNAGDNSFTGNGGNDYIDGDSGNDTVIFSFARDAATVSASNGIYTIVGPSGTSRVTNVENFKFANISYTTNSVMNAITPTSTYRLVSNQNSVNEGSTASFTLTTTNVAAGVSVPYTLTGISAADVSGGVLSGNAAVNSSGVATISVTLLNDNLTEGAETLTVTAGGATASTVVSDTSTTITPIPPTTPTFTTTNSISVPTSSLVVSSTAANDLITGSTATNVVDTVAYKGSIKDYKVAIGSNGNYTVIDAVSSRDGSDVVVNVERLKFLPDTSTGANRIALDLSPTQATGKAALLIGAILPGKLALDPSKYQLMGTVIDLFDQGYSLKDLSGALLRLPIWDVLTGKPNPTSADIATYLVNNVYGVTSQTANLGADLARSLAISSMAAETPATQGTYLATLATSTASQTHIDLVGIQATGLVYLG